MESIIDENREYRRITNISRKRVIIYKTFSRKVLSNSGFSEQYFSVCHSLFAGRTPG